MAQTPPLISPSKIILLAGLFLALAPIGALADEIRRSEWGEPESIDPQLTEGEVERRVQLDLFEGLTAFAADGTLTPGAADRWDVSADGKTYLFHLRPGLIWSNGDALTAEDFVYSFRRAADPKTRSPYTTVLSPIVGMTDITSGRPATLGVDAPDPLTVRIRLTHPTAYLPGLLTIPVAMPVHRRTVEAYGARWTLPEHFVGNGPFVLKEWVPQSHILLARNPRFHDAASVRIEHIRWLPDSDATTEFQRFQAGEIDVARVPVQQLAWSRTNYASQLRVTTQLAATYIGLNTARPPFADNPKLREALALTMDQRVLNEVVAPEGNVPAFGLVPPGITQYRPQSVAFREQSMSARIERARALYAEAGYGPDHPLAFELSYWNEPNSERRLAALASMWKRALGVKVTLVAREWQVFVAASRNHNFQAEILRWYADYSDPYTFLEIFRSDAGELNDIAYSNPAYDALLDESQATLDPAVRMALLERAEAMLLADGFVLPDHFLAEQTLVSDRIAGWQDNPLAFHPSRFLSIAATK